METRTVAAKSKDFCKTWLRGQQCDCVLQWTTERRLWNSAVYIWLWFPHLESSLWPDDSFHLRIMQTLGEAHSATPDNK